MGFLRRFSITTSIIILIIILACAYLLGMLGLFGESFDFSFGELAVALGTLLLALYTHYLGVTDQKESQTERRRLRIKERLEGLYSPLAGIMVFFNTEDSYLILKQPMHKFFTDTEILRNYEYLASDELIELLREYFNHDERHFTEPRWTVWQRSMRERIDFDFNELLEEYNQLSS